MTEMTIITYTTKGSNQERAAVDRKIAKFFTQLGEQGDLVTFDIENQLDEDEEDDGEEDDEV